MWACFSYPSFRSKEAPRFWSAKIAVPSSMSTALGWISSRREVRKGALPAEGPLVGILPSALTAERHFKNIHIRGLSQVVRCFSSQLTCVQPCPYLFLLVNEQLPTINRHPFYKLRHQLSLRWAICQLPGAPGSVGVSFDGMHFCRSTNMGGIGQGTSSHAMGILFMFEHDIRHLAFYMRADRYYHANSGSLVQKFDEERVWKQQEAVFSNSLPWISALVVGSGYKKLLTYSFYSLLLIYHNGYAIMILQ